MEPFGKTFFSLEILKHVLKNALNSNQKKPLQTFVPENEYFFITHYSNINAINIEIRCLRFVVKFKFT